MTAAFAISAPVRAQALKIAVELPFGETDECAGILHGVEMAASETHAGSFTLSIRPSDLTPHWDATVATANAAGDVADSAVVGVIGPFNSSSVFPINPTYNSAHLAVISPSNTNPGLTMDPSPIARFPTGILNYARVIPTDEKQGNAGARWAATMGVATAVVIDDGEGFGEFVAAAFEDASGAAGIRVLDARTVGPYSPGKPGMSPDIQILAAAVAAKHPDLVYYGGFAGGAVPLFRHLRAAQFGGLLMGPDGLIDSYLIKQLRPAAEGVLATSTAIAPELLARTAPGASWVAEYTARYGAPKLYSAYGYVAAKVLIRALESVPDPTDRDAVRAAVVGTKGFESILGTFSFDQNGDTSLVTMSGLGVQGGAFRVEALIQ